MRDLLDRFIDLFKWPVAIWVFFSIPAFIQAYDYFNFKNIKYIVFGIGFLAFFLARMGRSSMKISMQILAHEFAHAFFAVLTFHKIKGIGLAKDNSGGSMSFVGKGNWLIVVAPYFFPIMILGYIFLVYIYLLIFPNSERVGLIVSGFLGYFLAYHCDTVFSQVHSKQTDFDIVGHFFCFIFIPAANLWTIGNVLAFNSLGWNGIATYHQLIYKLNIENILYIKNLFF